VKGDVWFLLGASPDLRSQIELCAELHPRAGVRSSPIAGIMLASADLDHVLGLLLLRELQPLQVWATASTLEILRGGNSMFGMLNRAKDQVRWNPIRSSENFSLLATSGNDSGITCRAIPLSPRHPAYAKTSSQSEDAVLGLVLTSPSGKTLGFFPQLPKLTPELVELFAGLDCLLLDGTFWSDDELVQLQGQGQRATEMGHIPVGGEQGTLVQLSQRTKPRRMYIHINNTNPMLNEAGAEYRAVCDAGWDLAEDGCHFTL